MTGNVSLPAAFAAGFPSFISSCVLPLILTGQLTIIVRYLQPYLPVF